MKKLGTQAKSQFSYMKAHKGKMVGTGLGIATGVVYGMSGKQSNMVIAGLAVVGAAAGAILGGMFDKPNAVVVGTNGDAAVANSGDEQAMSNAIGSIARRNQFNRINLKGGVASGLDENGCDTRTEKYCNHLKKCVSKGNWWQECVNTTSGGVANNQTSCPRGKAWCRGKCRTASECWAAGGIIKPR